MITDPSLASSLEALFHKAFLFPRLDQRSEALKLIKKILGDGSKMSKIAKSCVITKSLSLWRMLMTCIVECTNPQLELSIDSVKTVVAMVSLLRKNVDVDSQFFAVRRNETTSNSSFFH